MLIKEKEENYIKKITERINTRVGNIDSITNKQIEILEYNLDRTKKISDKLDSVENNIHNLLEKEDALLTQYRSVNKKLKNQIEYELLQLNEKKAVLEIYDRNVNWEVLQDSSTRLKLCISNLGKRNAEILGGSGLIIFFDHNLESLYKLRIPGTKSHAQLSPSYIKGDIVCYFSHTINPLENLKEKAKFAVIQFNISYKDLLLETIIDKTFYKLWSPRLDDFGGPTNWQIDLFEKEKLKLQLMNMTLNSL